MDIYINSLKLPNVIDCAVRRVTRNTKTEFNANGDMLIDLVSRKHVLTIHLGVLSSTQLRQIYNIAENIFFSVSFESPVLGQITSQFHLKEQNAETNFIHQGITYYKALKLVLEER
ncbi:MAG: hypothetical protein FWE60_05080 [Oscillospiraceae bacterium]|nr:hypothetical protein [Oscillospiraceae bacterium]